MNITHFLLKPRAPLHKLSIVGLLTLLPLCGQAQEASNIYLGNINYLNGAAISELHAVTKHDSYTNQPYFFSEHELYYTQSVKSDGTEQMDTFVYDILKQTNTNLSQSQASEYSPTPLPSRKGYSVIRVNTSGKQELWSYTKDGRALTHLVPAIEPVGYQVWINKHELLLFVLGEPHTLQRVDITKPEAAGNTVDDNIGASLYRFQKSDWFLYSKQTDNTKAPVLKAYNAVTQKSVEIGQLKTGSQYFSISPTGHLLTSDSKDLHHRRVTISGGKPMFKGIWNKVNIGNQVCQNGISRTAVSNFGDKVALVCNQ